MIEILVDEVEAVVELIMVLLLLVYPVHAVGR